MSDLLSEETRVNRYTPDERDEYVKKANELLGAGYSIKAAAEHIGVAHQTLYSWLQRPPPDEKMIKQRAYKNDFDKRKSEAIRRLRAGERPIDIHNELGISKATLQVWKRRLAGRAPVPRRSVSLQSIGDEAVRITTGIRSSKPPKNGRSPSRPMVVLIGDEEKLSNMISGLRSIFRGEEE